MTTAPAPAATDTVKLTVALPQEAIDRVTRMAAASHKSKTQILREAIALKDFIEDEIRKDGRFLIEHDDGTTRQIVFTA